MYLASAGWCRGKGWGHRGRTRGQQEDGLQRIWKHRGLCNSNPQLPIQGSVNGCLDPLPVSFNSNSLSKPTVVSMRTICFQGTKNGKGFSIERQIYIPRDWKCLMFTGGTGILSKHCWVDWGGQMIKMTSRPTGAPSINLKQWKPL